MSFWTDETFWIALAGVVGAALTTAGLGSVAVPVQGVIDAVAGILATTYVGGRAHQRATAIKAAGPVTVAATSSPAAAGPDTAAAAPAAAAPTSPPATGETAHVLAILNAARDALASTAPASPAGGSSPPPVK